MKLKEQVRTGKLKPQQALDLLRRTDPVHGEKTRTALWLKRQGAH